MPTRNGFWQEKLKAYIQDRTRELGNGHLVLRPPTRKALERLLQDPLFRDQEAVLVPALTDPYFPLVLIPRTVLADVVGMRFFVSKRRPEIQGSLARAVMAMARLFLRVREDLKRHGNPNRVTGIPLDGRPRPLSPSGWCRLCGTCCQIGGVRAVPPPGMTYPPAWVRMIQGEADPDQFLCPFLFQYFGREIYFCAIHPIKPRACAGFGPEDCARCAQDIALHAL